MKHISIVGFGRFGRTLYRLIKDDFAVVLYNRSGISPRSIELTEKTRIATDLEEVYSSDVIFFAVPISAFESVIRSHKKYIKPHHLLIDVLSVKLHPAKVFSQHFKGGTVQVLLTHPMFGPDSSKDGFEGLPMILDKFMTKDDTCDFWKKYFQSKKLNVIEMSADAHDKLAADSQGITHFVGRLLNDFGLKPTVIDTLGARKLHELVDQTCNDTWELFEDLQRYNPYTTSMRNRLVKSYGKLNTMLSKSRSKKSVMKIGIQGGRGSFNEEALLSFVKRQNITNYTIVYLYTSENVLKALNQNTIDRGQLAIFNSAGGIVEESIHALAKYTSKIVDTFDIRISHALMIRKDADPDDIKIIMTHPQVIAQCRHNLKRKYPFMQLTTGSGVLVDHALVAKRLSQGKLPKHIATMGSRVLADMYKLKVIDENLQDLRDNFTTFLHLDRH